MTFLRTRNEYKCDICGRVGFFDEGTWTRYSSLLLDETVPNSDIPVACSEPCRVELAHRVETGQIDTPKLRNRGPYSDVVGPGKGYGRFMGEPLATRESR